MKDLLVIASRESRLALWQAEHVRTLLRERAGVQASVLGMSTRGDEILDRSLSKVGGKGLFVKELETALEDGRARLAVHSLKDVPMELPPGFTLAAVLEREDPRDAFVSNDWPDLDSLPEGARVGTSSLRRSAQLLARRPDLRIEPLRGNLDTRLRKLDEGGYDAIVLAAAGLVRLGLEARIRARFDPRHLLPCAGQGALGLEIRADDAELLACLAPLSHADTWLATHAERAVSRALGGSCSMPLAAYARRVEPGRTDTGTGIGVGQAACFELHAVLGDSTGAGRPLLRYGEIAEVNDVSAAEALGLRVAEGLRAAGADDYLSALPAAARKPG